MGKKEVSEMTSYLTKNKILQLFGIFFIAVVLSGCSSKSWNWFYNDDDEEIEEIVIDEEPVEEVIEISDGQPGSGAGDDQIVEEVVYVYVDEDGNELYREVVSAEQMKNGSSQQPPAMQQKQSQWPSQGRSVRPKYGDEPALANRREANARGAANSYEGLPENIILFPYKKIQPDARGMRLLEKHAERLRANPDMIVTIEGHTDGVASYDYNKRLGLERARRVAKILEEMGVNTNQTVTISYGKERPLRRGNDPQSQALNRRVEIVY